MFKRERHLFSNYNCNKLNKTDMLSLRENLNGAGRVLRVAGQKYIFFKTSFWENFLPNTTVLRKRKRGRKSSRNLLPLRTKKRLKRAIGPYASHKMKHASLTSKSAEIGKQEN